jgi:hypothetical protein
MPPRGIAMTEEHKRKIGAANKKWTLAEEALLRAEYPATHTAILAKRLDRSERVVRNQAMRLGLTKIVRSTYYMSYRKHDVSPTIYDALTPSLAYVLGMILADGNLRGSTLTISNKEADLLNKIRLVLGTTAPATPRSKDQHVWYILVLTNKRLSEWLNGYGITERKSLSAILPTVTDDLLPHLVRGYFDGDGTVQFSPRQGLVARFTSGSPVLLNQLADRLTAVVGLPSRRVTHDRNRPNANRLAYYGPSALALADAMYADANDLFLLRKRTPFEEYRRHIATP